MNDTPAGDPPLYYGRHVFCCTNERAEGHPRGCCREKGAVELRSYMKKQAKAKLGPRAVRVNTAGCLDRCELGPCLVIYPEGVWYRVDSEADIDEIIESHLIGGGRVDRLMLQPQDVLPRDMARRQTAG